jgi:hypothetical protein
MGRPLRFSHTLLLAAAAHGLLALVMRARRGEAPREGEQTVWLDLSDDAPVASASAKSAPSPEGDNRVASMSAPKGRRSDAPRSTSKGTPEEPGAPSPEATASAPSGEPSAEPSVHLTREQLGLAGPNRFLAPGASGEGPAGPEARRAGGVEASVRRALDERDRELGLDSAGPAITALEQATMQSTAPSNSRARFEVVADASGHVTSVRVLDVSEDFPSWQRVAAQALRALEGKVLRNAGPRGVAMTIAVESRWQLPSGSDPGVEVEIVGTTAKAGEGKRSPKVSILKPRINLVPVDPDGGLKVPEVSITVLELAGDPTDIGAKPLRTVRAHLVEQKRP